MNDCMVVSSAD